MEPILVPPGKTQTWKCPAGSDAAVTKGQIIKSGDKASLYVVDVGPDGIVLGPLVAGEFEVAGLCKDQAAVSFRIEAPDPAKVDKKIRPLMPLQLPYPWWLWLVLLAALALAVGLGWLVKRLLSPKHDTSLLLARARLKKSPLEKMEIFLSKAETQQLAQKDDVLSSQLLYGDGLRHLRALLQEAYGFKAPGATTTEFISELKAQALRKPSVLTAPQVAQLESTFMQAKQVTYAREIPELALRNAYFKSLKDFYTHLESKISAIHASASAARRKPLFKKKEKT
ncbi:MAG: hypothetical protein ABIR96_00595 [Bdellovibrionota bacterium]